MKGWSKINKDNYQSKVLDDTYIGIIVDKDNAGKKFWMVYFETIGSSWHKEFSSYVEAKACMKNEMEKVK